MSKIWTKISGLVVSGLLLAACVAPDNGASFVSGTPAADGIMLTKLVVEGVDSNVALANTIGLREALKDFGGAPGNRLGVRIENIRAANLDSSKQVPGLTGLGGIFGHAMLDRGQAALIETGNNKGRFNRATRVIVSVTGQIEDYEFTKNSGTPCQLNGVTYTTCGKGKIVATTYITETVVTAGLGAPPPRTEAYRYEIEVEEGGFVVVNRDDSAADGPFPNTMTFDQEQKDRITSLGFTRKLWAIGNKIKIKRIWHKKPMPNSSFEEIFETQPKYARLFETDPTSCIDMMFVGEPPADMAGLQGPPFYCLGRCANPLIVNTGW